MFKEEWHNHCFFSLETKDYQVKYLLAQLRLLFGIACNAYCNYGNKIAISIPSLLSYHSESHALL